MKLVDSGKVLKQPVKWVYVLCGVFSFVPFVVCLYFVCSDFLNLENFLGYGYWTNFVSIFMLFMFLYELLILGLICFWYWMNRKNNLDNVVETGSRTTAIPLVADIAQCCGESFTILLVFIPIGAAVLYLVTLLLTDGGGFYSKLRFVNYILLFIAVVVSAVIIGYLHLMLVRFVTEHMRLYSQIGNDVHRIAIDEKIKDVRHADHTNVKFHVPAITKKEKKIAIYAVAGAAVVAFVVVFVQFLIISSILNRPITEELESDQITKVSRKHKNFGLFCGRVQNAVNSLKNDTNASVYEYESISYGNLFSFCNKYVYDDELIEEISDEYHEKYEKAKIKADELMTAFESEIDNDLGRYLEISITNKRYGKNEGYSSSPEYNFSYSEPKEKLADATIKCYFEDEDGEMNTDIGYWNVSLKEIEDAKRNGQYWYEKVSDSEFWDKYTIVIEIEKIITADGKKLTWGPSGPVSQSMRKYIEEKSEDNLRDVIVEHVDRSLESSDTYIEKWIEEAMKEYDEKCYKFYVDYMK